MYPDSITTRPFHSLLQLLAQCYQAAGLFLSDGVADGGTLIHETMITDA